MLLTALWPQQLKYIKGLHTTFTRYQGGHVTFLCDQHKSPVPIAWSSTRIKHITWSTLAAQTLALMNGFDTAFFIAKLITDVTQTTKIPIHTINHSMTPSTLQNKPLIDV